MWKRDFVLEETGSDATKKWIPERKTTGGNGGAVRKETKPKRDKANHTQG